MITEDLKRTPLFDAHVALKAKMVPFGGWEMPVQYDSIIAEYEQTRRAVTVFDTSHMGEFLIEGDLKESGLDRIVTMTLSDLAINSCRYGVILNAAGGVIDDLIVFRQEKEKWFIVVNAGTIDKDAKHFRAHLTQKAQFKDISSQTAKLDVQGPQARDILTRLSVNVEKLDYYTFDFFNLMGENVLISRTGYTGELGYEIFYPWGKIQKVWNKLLEMNVKPAGLGARDILRLEMGYSLYGHELEENINPLESGLARFIDLNKDFIGKEALLKSKEKGLQKKIIGVTSESRRAPRAGQKIFDVSHKEIGIISSGTFSPHLNKGIGLGFVDAAKADLNGKIFFGDDRIKAEAIITGKSFYKNGSLKS